MRSNHTEKIILYDRVNKAVFEETVYEKNTMDFLYGTKTGCVLTSLLLKRRWFSRIYGCLERRESSKEKIQLFIEKYRIDTSEIELPLWQFRNFNEFFTRKLIPSARPVSMEPDTLISPADSRLLAYGIRQNLVIPVKGVPYTIGELISDDELAKGFINGLCLVFRLAPFDYHRFCYIDDGVQMPLVSIDGSLDSVHPLSLANNKKVFQKNYRQYNILRTKNFGDVIHIDVGAMTAGKIKNHHTQKYIFKRGEEKGYFELGGSTCILIFKQGTVSIDADIMEYSAKGIETVVRYGAGIGRKMYRHNHNK